jgi:hypothetical protein
MPWGVSGTHCNLPPSFRLAAALKAALQHECCMVRSFSSRRHMIHAGAPQIWSRWSSSTIADSQSNSIHLAMDCPRRKWLENGSASTLGGGTLSFDRLKTYSDVSMLFSVHSRTRVQCTSPNLTPTCVGIEEGKSLGEGMRKKFISLYPMSVLIAMSKITSLLHRWSQRTGHGTRGAQAGRVQSKLICRQCRRWHRVLLSDSPSIVVRYMYLRQKFIGCSSWRGMLSLDIAKEKAHWMRREQSHLMMMLKSVTLKFLTMLWAWMKWNNTRTFLLATQDPLLSSTRLLSSEQFPHQLHTSNAYPIRQQLETTRKICPLFFQANLQSKLFSGRHIHVLWMN